MSNRLYFITITGFLLIFLAGCQTEKRTERDYPQIRTLPVDKITSEGARFNAAIISGDAESIKEHGFVWGEYNYLTLDNAEKVVIENAPSTDQFSCDINFSLKEMKEYYVRSYIKAGQFVVYGDAVKFTSLGSMAPEITDFEPKAATWGDTVTIYGKNLTFQQNSVKVHFGTILATVLKSSSEEITVKVPDQLNNISSVISMDILGNQTVANGNFTLLTYGSVESVFPATAKWGDTLVIKGVFPYKEHAIALRINYIATTITDLKENQIIAIFPPSNYAQSVEIQLGVDLHWIATGVFITMLNPNITSISPASFGWDDTIIIKGTFIPDITRNQVLFNSTSAKVLKADNTSLTCIVPLLQTHSAQLEIKTGSYSSAYPNAIDLKGPEITSIIPAVATSISAITINGKYFNPENNTSLSFNNIDNFNISSITTRQITGNLNGNVTSNGPVTVSVSVSGKSKSYTNLLTIADPKILSVSPAYAFYGEIVTVEGENFDPDDIHITLCNTFDVEIVSATASEIQFRMPLKDVCGSGFSLETRGVKIGSYEDPRITPPVINSISPATGKPGDIITLTGDYFNPDPANNEVYFDYSTHVTALDGDRYHIDVKVPSLPTGSYNLEVSTGGSGAQAGTFQCNSPWRMIGWTFDDRMDPSVIVTNNTMYLLGGMGNNSGYYQVYNCTDNHVDVYEYGITEMRDLMGCAAFVIGNNAYIGIGNSYNRSEYTASFYKIALGDNSSVKLNDFPGDARSGSFYFSVGTHGYFGTGNNNGTLYADFWEYVSSTDTWTKKADYPGGAAAGASAVVHNNIAYIIEGKNVYSYNPSTDLWTKKATFPGIARACGVAINDVNGIYYGAGAASFEINLNNKTCYQDFWYYSIATNSWKRLTDFPMSRRSMYGYSYNGKIYLGGGYSMDNENYYRNYHDVYEFDPNF